MTNTHSEEVAVRLTGIRKSFGPTKALDDAELVLRRGTVHALLGGNGSGKSTALKILAGVHEADAGVIQVGREQWPARTWSAAAGSGAGLRFVHQDLGLFDALSVAENFALDAGYPTTAVRSVRWKELERRVVSLLDRFEIAADPRQPVGSLRPAQRTMVAIARALQDDDSTRAVLVLDEPTATLPAHESEVLLGAIRRRAELGQTVLLVSHRMQEVLSVAQDFTVFRDGRTVATLSGENPTEDRLVALMTGRELERAPQEPAATTAAPPAAGSVSLQVENLVSGPLRGVTLAVRQGEIVGVTGLVGSGRSSLLKTVFGAHRPESGTITLSGRSQSGAEDVKARMAQGVAYVAEDRVAESSLMELTVRENISVSRLRRFWRPRGMNAAEERRSAADLVRRHRVKTTGVDGVFSSLSGGNQQKAVLARWLCRDPSLLLLDEPTQGVDVMSRRDIYDTIRQSVSAGCAVLVASSDFAELCALCDRVLVLQDGVVTAELSGTRLTPDHLTAATQSSVLTTGDQP
ncbi:sugar ABC transporter ATP-binding protein [Streptomyces neyagawaensis]|uniref:sugar ABC transporter ATP-binding protein n=1 Tax=Streptomyces neyagawaensis TaxID=42238 RepID=UPI0007C79C2D|nr:sugar ABC transporter ATP-binding protein [Streptomyces neyagawaensis]MCL6732272.1 sugar ABC transporter ATP-binding protein [Streptomyces neyagawaensis]MDE1685752.1 sugar ABC transporter ATP-binding protein [Streptomyces neyagawaensis]